MPRNGNGVYVPVSNTFNPAVDGTTIEPGSTGWQGQLDDIAAGLTQSLSKDGQTAVTGNLPMGGFKLTGLAAGTAATDSVNLGQVAAAGYSIATVGGTADVITLTLSPAISAYAAGQTFQFTATGTNTTNVTVAVSGLAAKAVQANSAALVAGDIVSGRTYVVRYDGTRFQLFASRAAVSHTADIADAAVTLAKLDTTGTAAFLTATTPGSAPTWGTSYAATTFTPGLAFGGAAVSMTFSSRTGSYIRVGALVIWSVNITLSAKGSSTGSATITGLPFTGSFDGTVGTLMPSSNMAGLTAGGNIYLSGGVGTTTAIRVQTTTGSQALTEANFANTSSFYASGWFVV